MEQKKKNSAWPTVAIIGKGKSGKTYLKFDDTVTILVNGQPVELGEGRFANLVSPTEEVEGMIKRGVITEDKAESRRSAAAGSSVKYKVIIPPVR